MTLTQQNATQPSRLAGDPGFWMQFPYQRGGTGSMRNIWPIYDVASRTFPIYSRANVAEIFPDPISPLNASAGLQVNMERGWRDAFVACGVWDHDLYDATADYNILPAFGSYLYINMSLMRLFGVRVPGMTAETVDLQYFGRMPGIPSYDSERRDFDVSPEFSAKAGAWLVEDVLGATDLSEFDADRKNVREIRAQRPDLTSLTDRELRDRIIDFGPTLQGITQRHIEVSLKAGVGLGAVAQFADAVGRPELALTLVSGLGLGDVDSTGPSTEMWVLSRRARTGALNALFEAGVDGLYERIADAASEDPEVREFRSDLDRFLVEWDFRGPSEWEMRAKTWGTTPALALAAIERMRLVDDAQAPEGKNAERTAQRESATATMRELLAEDPEKAAQFEAALRAAGLWLRGRERARTTAAMLLHELRLAALELGLRSAVAGCLDTEDHIFMLFADELDHWLEDPAAYRETLRAREKVYLDLFEYEPPFVVVGQPGPVTEWHRRSERTAAPVTADEVLTGVPTSGGVARGRARVVMSPDDPSALDPGDVLIAPHADPSWTPLFVSAAAVIVEVGAPVSHIAIVSRELGIPCIAVAEATLRIPDGAMIEVDGNIGQVTVI
ncbi:PEP-utilizing enzyme [Streptomyces sp. NPDC059680]|uniref:PEP-utilizing enzyme n=1 Tax=Streptomyces sp. NPDC059680 TaxID=3346904 RepID=UPI0036C93C83